MKRQLAAEAAALLAFSALRNNDKVGLLLFTEHTERLIRPQKGRSHVLRVLREILATRPAGRGTDLASALRTLTHLSRQRAIVALVTDLFDANWTGEQPPEELLYSGGLRRDQMTAGELMRMWGGLERDSARQVGPRGCCLGCVCRWCVIGV